MNLQKIEAKGEAKETIILFGAICTEDSIILCLISVCVWIDKGHDVV